MTLREQYIKAYRILRLTREHTAYTTRNQQRAVSIFTRLIELDPRAVGAAYCSLYAPIEVAHQWHYMHMMVQKHLNQKYAELGLV